MPATSRREPEEGSFLAEVASPPHKGRSGGNEGGEDTSARRQTRGTASTSSSSPPLPTSYSTDGSPTTRASASPRRPSAVRRRPGLRVRLCHFLFPDEEAAGVEGAARHYGHGGGAAPHTAALDDAQADTRGGEADGAVWDAMEPWHYIQVPLSRVLLFLRLQQRLADQWTQTWMYAPFYVLLLLFVFVGPGRGASQNAVDFDTTRRASFAQSSGASEVRESILVEAFRLNTEATAPATSTNSVGDFIQGDSVRHPWMYSWYNETVNIWTAPANARRAVDTQVESVAATHHEPTLLSLTSIRTRRDALRWLQLQLTPRLWNCESPKYERPWRSTVTGAHYQLGAVRLISRRYQQSGPVLNVSVDDADTASASAEVDVTVAGVPSMAKAESEYVAHVTPTVYEKQAAPPQIPRFICGGNDPSVMSAEGPAFTFESGVGGYVAILPFSTSCATVRTVLSTMQTPKKRVLWPPAYNASFEMRAAWMDYTETDRPINATAAATAALCSSFIFDPAVSEVVVQYVAYATKTNQYTVVEVSFAMSSSGANVRPRLSTFSLHALQWSFSATPLAFSISLALTIIFYGNYLLRRLLEQYSRNFSRIARLHRTSSQQLWCVLYVVGQTQNLVHILALVMSAAAVGSWWHTLARLTNVPEPRYADRSVYPQDIDDIVRHSGVLLPRLCASAVFFATIGLVRFAAVTPGLWLCVQTVACSAPRLALIFSVWMTVNVGMAILSVLLYGPVLYEFRTFEGAFTTLMVMFLDGGRSMMNAFAVASQSGHLAMYAQDDSLPGIHGSQLGRIEPVLLDYRYVVMALSNHANLPGFLICFFYLQSVVLVVWGALTILESYRNVLLLPDAEVLPLWRGMWTLQFSSLTRTATAEYAKEVIQRVLLSRDEAAMLREMEYYLRRGYAQAPVAARADLLSHDGAGETAVSLTMVLWLLPRELQPEYGAAHLRRLWYLCVAAVMAAQRADQPWKSARWRQHWQQQPSSLSGWLRASLPADDTIEEQAARVGMQLEELPNSVVRYVEGKFM